MKATTGTIVKKASNNIFQLVFEDWKIWWEKFIECFWEKFMKGQQTAEDEQRDYVKINTNSNIYSLL